MITRCHQCIAAQGIDIGVEHSRLQFQVLLVSLSRPGIILAGLITLPKGKEGMPQVIAVRVGFDQRFQGQDSSLVVAGKILGAGDSVERSRPRLIVAGSAESDFMLPNGSLVVAVQNSLVCLDNSFSRQGSGGRAGGDGRKRDRHRLRHAYNILRFNRQGETARQQRQ